MEVKNKRGMRVEAGERHNNAGCSRGSSPHTSMAQARLSKYTHEQRCLSGWEDSPEPFARGGLPPVPSMGQVLWK